MALLNNLLESRSDAFKIMVHVRRPIPIRTDSIGPWLGCLRSVTWAAALANTILVRLFNHRFSLSTDSTTEERKALLTWALLASLGASHGYLLLQHAVKIVVERVFWRDSPEDMEVTTVERKVKNICLIALKDGNEDHHQHHAAVLGDGEAEGDMGDFWKLDEGIDELRRDHLKDA
jgi:anoctamin-10